MKVDPHHVTQLLEEAAAQFVLPRFNHLSQSEIQEKAPGDLVTVADLEAERYLTGRLGDLLPGSLVVGEEAHSKSPEILRRFDEDNPVWVIDPVDGTNNFTKASQTFCMMVALVVRQQPVMGWIHDPIPGRTAVAELGGGAWIGTSRMTVPDPPPETGMTGLINAWYFEEPQRSRIKSAARNRFGTIGSLSCAGQDFLAQAEGRRHFSFYRRLWPWDHAAGTLLLREAGGMVERVDGMAYRAGDRSHGLLTAANETLWHQIRDFLLDR